MKRYLVFALAIIFAFSVSCAIAADSTWTLNGTWNYKATIPSTTIKTGDVVSATESGTITMNMTTKDGAEYFDSYVIKGKGQPG
ncbi:MAG: hypothetical protein Q4F74_04340 [Synergistaceae bacterium]|nr:hypothetical protein [Synergistaceae bacterium]